MSSRKPYRPVGTGVNFHPAVIDYLDQVCVSEDCDRSALINRIVREHARQRSVPLGPIAPQQPVARCPRI